jgi:hypothetical protein
MHPPDNRFSNVKYRLDKKAAVFKAAVALDDGVNFTRNPAVFEAGALPPSPGTPVASAAPSCR